MITKGKRVLYFVVQGDDVVIRREWYPGDELNRASAALERYFGRRVVVAPQGCSISWPPPEILR